MLDAAHFHAQAANCRSLAADADEATAANLLMLAEECEEEARRLEAGARQPPAE